MNNKHVMWLVIENIIWCIAFVSLLLLLDGLLKIIAFIPLIFVNTRFTINN